MDTHMYSTLTSTTTRRLNNHNHKCLQLSANPSVSQEEEWGAVCIKRQIRQRCVSVCAYLCSWIWSINTRLHTALNLKVSPHLLLLIFSFSAVIINLEEGRKKDTSKTFPSRHLFSVSFILSLTQDIFTVLFSPFFPLNPTSRVQL